VPVEAIVINLERDVARMAHMRGELERCGIKYSRFSAIDGAQLPADYARYFPDSAQSVLSRGEVGCYASHLAVCGMIARREVASPTLVLEDDVALTDALPDILNNLIETLPAGWDLVRLSNNAKHACIEESDLGEGRHLVRYSNVPSSAGAILWSKSGAEKFLAARVRTLPVDQDLRLVWAWDLDTYGVLPAPVLRDRCGASRIDAMAPKGWREEARHLRYIRGARRRDVLHRHAHGVRAFGARRWFAAEAFNLLKRLGGGAPPLIR
jgi:glycosyl transferase family 25